MRINRRNTVLQNVQGAHFFWDTVDDVVTCVSVAPKIRSFPKVFLGTFENAAPDQSNGQLSCIMLNVS